MSVIAYQGFVQILRRYKGKFRGSNIYHNSGSYHLFKLLTQFLSSGEKSASIQPTYLDVGYMNGNSWESCLYQKIKITSRTETTITDTTTKTTIPAVICIWDISANHVNNSKDTGQQIKLRAYNSAEGNADEYLMEVSLIESNGTSITQYNINQGESHEIAWTMSFTNAKSQNS